MAREGPSEKRGREGRRGNCPPGDWAEQIDCIVLIRIFNTKASKGLLREISSETRS
jgi:hypothetical protein